MLTSPAKRAAYATDPVQALTLLRRRAADLSDTEFNRAVSEIITGLRDAHTRYIGGLRGCVIKLRCCRFSSSNTALSRDPNTW